MQVSKSALWECLLNVNKGIFNQNSWLEADTTVPSELSIPLKCEFNCLWRNFAGSVNQKMKKTIKV